MLNAYESDRKSKKNEKKQTNEERMKNEQKKGAIIRIMRLHKSKSQPSKYHQKKKRKKETEAKYAMKAENDMRNEKKNKR